MIVSFNQHGKYAQGKTIKKKINAHLQFSF